MATWVTHLIVADRVLKRVSGLDRHGFCVGNIAPDCNVENEDWTQFTPSRAVTHWMSSEKKTASDCDRFYREYIEDRKQAIETEEEHSFLLGYYAHLLTDAEFLRFVQDENRIAAVWKRIKEHPLLSKQSFGMQEDWDAIKVLLKKENRMKDIYSMEAEYLDQHPESGYFTEILELKEFPNYVDYLPNGAIVRKIGVMGYMPKRELGEYPYIGMSRGEYQYFVDRAVQLVTEALVRMKK